MAIRSNSSPAPVPLIAQAQRPEIDGTSALAPMPEDPPTLEGTIEPGRLATVEPAKRLEVFTTLGGLDSIIESIVSVARKHKPDVTTDKGRKAIASNAYQVAKCKILLDDAGKEETAKAKEIPNKIDAARRDMRARLEALQTEVRKPLTDWEEEQERIKAEALAKEEAKAFARQMESDHEIAITLNWAYDQKRREELETLERDQQAREEEIAREAAKKATEEAAQREADLKAAVEKAEREKAEAEQRAKDAEARANQERKDAEARAIQEKEAATKHEEQAAIESAQRERDRQAAAKKAEDDATAARTRDQEHRKTFNNEIMADIVRMTGLSEESAKSVISAIAMGRVRHVSIAY
jgi:hypothetical protein